MALDLDLDLVCASVEPTSEQMQSELWGER